jgi:hypothetical protein
MTDHKRPETIPGYVHPEAVVNYSRRDRGMYKTFTEGEQSAGVQTFNSTTTEAQYVNYADSDDEEAGESNRCPKCKEPAISVCNCAYNDKRCKLGHIWYTDRSGAVKNGNPHK